MIAKYKLILMLILFLQTFSCNNKIQNKELSLVEKRTKISEWFIWGLMLYGQKTIETDRHPLSCYHSIEHIPPTRFEYLDFFHNLIYEVRIDSTQGDYYISENDKNRVHKYLFTCRLIINQNGDTCYSEYFIMTSMHIFYFKDNDTLPFLYHDGRNAYPVYDANLYKFDERSKERKLDIEKMNSDLFFKYWGNREREDSFNLYLLGLDENIRTRYKYAAKSRGYNW